MTTAPPFPWEPAEACPEVARGTHTHAVCSTPFWVADQRNWVEPDC